MAKVIDAVAHHRVYLMRIMPKQGYPMPEAVNRRTVDGEKLYPQNSTILTHAKGRNDWYQRFYRTDYQGVQ